LAKNGVPVRTIHLPRIDEEHTGELLMHFMLETIIAAHLLGVDAFDQPAVEEGKVLANKYLTSLSFREAAKRRARNPYSAAVVMDSGFAGFARAPE
jgi:glucose-6-phosphate isomerase